MNYKCFKCGAEMDKSIESGHTVLKCSKCFNKWVSPEVSGGIAFQNPHGTKHNPIFKKVVDDDNDDETYDSDYKTEEEKKRIQEEEGLSDEDMANGAWIDF